ncbi:TPR repeat-containing protein [Calothrix sp. NIES-4071]|nr:TPR repeat-containing protein [Calothrix sp. NIES-4071]BAZ57629.1 TPR repeat-containing protein [Calothrix sp. NIES-4105]
MFLSNRLQSFLVLLAFNITFQAAPLSGFAVKPFNMSQAVAQTSSASKNQADKLIKEGEQLRDSLQLQAALKKFSEALNIYRQNNNKAGEGKALNHLGNTYGDLNQVQEALSYYQQGIEVAKATGDTGLEARILSNIGLTYRDSGDLTRAIEYCNKAVSVARKSGNYETEALALKGLGAIAITSDIGKGIDYVEQALAAIRKANGTGDDRLRQRNLEASILMSLGGLYYAIGVGGGLTQTDVTPSQAPGKLLDKSLQYYQQAAVIAKETGDNFQRGKALSGVGSVYNIRSEFAQAVKSYEQAVEIFKKQGSQIQVRDTLSSLAEVYSNWNNKDKAISYYQQALAINQATNNPVTILDNNTSQGLIQVNIANAYADTSKYEQAIKFYEQAIKTLKTSLNQTGSISTSNPTEQFLVNKNKLLANQGIKASYLRLCVAYRTLGQDEASNKACKDASSISASTPEALPQKTSKELEEAQRSLASAQSVGNRNLEAFALAKIATAYVNLGEKKQAREYFQKAIELARTYPLFEYYALFQAGLFEQNQQQYNLAINYYKQAAASANKNNQKQEEANIFRQLGTLYYTRKNLPEATTALYNAIKVYESIRVDLTDKNQISIFETQAQVYSLLQKVLVAQNKYQEALEVSERGRARAFINLLAARQPQNKNNIPEILPPTIKDIQKIAKQQNATFVEYSIKDTDIYIWVVKPTGEIAFQKVNLNSNTPLKDVVATALDSIGATRGLTVVAPHNKKPEPNARQKLKALHELLITPIAQHLPKNPNERVIFVPQNELFLIPFPALQDNQGKYLIEKHTILTAPSIQLLQLTHERRPSSSQAVLVVGNPIMPGIPVRAGQPPQQLVSLPFAEKEAREIATMLNTKPLIGKDATKSQVKRLMTQARIIHLATHGLLDDFGDSIPGAIALAPSSTNLLKTQQSNDGLLTASEILNMKLNADLVVLSACQTGQGTLTGDGVIGLSRSLIAAGTKSVVVSLWSVDDASTKLLMTEFYRQMQKNPDKGAALRQAMLVTMKQYPSPEHWSAFTLIGESI